MKNLGVKEKDYAVTSIPLKKDKQRIIYPSICFNSKALPDVKNLRIGDEIEITSKLKVTGLREGYDDKTEIKCDMDMISAEITDAPDDMKEAKQRNLSRKDWEEIRSKKGTKNA